MKNSRKNLVRAIVLTLITVMCISAFTACGSKKAKITIEVTNAEGTTSTFTGKTDAEFLLGAIEDIKGVTIDGYSTDWGYYMTAVNGEEADLNVGAYWAVYVDGEYGMYAIDAQPVTDGAVYGFVYEIFEYTE